MLCKPDYNLDGSRGRTHPYINQIRRCGRALYLNAIDDRVQLVLSVDNMNTSVSGHESLNGAAEPGCDLLEIDVFDGTKAVRA
jgi:hypothetical protein